MNKIMLKEFLSNLDSRCEENGINIEPLTCLQISKECFVTPATITNLNKNSKISLIMDICHCIYFHYIVYFETFMTYGYDYFDIMRTIMIFYIE